MNNEGSEVLTSCVCGADFLWYQEIDHVDLNKENIYLAGDKKHVFIIYFKSFFAHFSEGNVFISGSQYEKHCRPFLQNQVICFQKKLSNNCWQHFWSKYVCVRNHMKMYNFLSIGDSVINCSIYLIFLLKILDYFRIALK